jgi:uncharacterized membrane protein
MTGSSVPARSGGSGFVLRGLVTLLPAALTLFILAVVVQFLNRYVTGPVNSVIYASLERTAPGWALLRGMGLDPTDPDLVRLEGLPSELQDLGRQRGLLDPLFQERLASYRAEEAGLVRIPRRLGVDEEELRDAVQARVPPLVGIVVSFLLALSAGYLASGFLGRRAIGGIDRALQRIPLIRSVHPYTKQFVDFFLSDNKLEFESVVAVEFFNPGVWSLAFVTGQGMRSISGAAGEEVVTLFMPSSPMPMTGFTVFIPRSRVVALPITVEDAVRVIVSGGVLVPPAESAEALTEALRAEEREVGSA